MPTAAQIRAAVASALAAVEGLCVDVEHEAQTGRSSSGAPTYAAAVTRSGVISRKSRVVRSQDGAEQASVVEMVFPAPFAVAPGDRFTTAGGEVFVALVVEYTTDSGTNAPYACSVFC
jgi:hypothetical protein